MIMLHLLIQHAIDKMPLPAFARLEVARETVVMTAVCEFAVLTQSKKIERE